MSNIVYHRKSTTLRDVIVLQDTDATFVTGLVNANFSKNLTKDGTGNQAVTGITVTEIDAVNNPGVYEVLVASSAFVAANGTYALSIRRTAAPLFSYEQIYIVNDTGTSGSSTSSFTATSGDGRVTDGTNPVSGATVYLSVGGVYYTETTTTATGVWGPVYLADGTYTVYAQKTGYAQKTATVTVSGGTVTGPGADIALAIGSVTDPLSASQLWSYARRMAVDLTGTKADAIIKGAVHDALDMVSSERLWPHLLRKGYLAMVAPYSTGTITITAGSNAVVLTTGTFPTWAASGKILVKNQILDIDTRVDGNNLTLANNWGDTTITASTYVIYQNEYDLPNDMCKFHRALPGQRWGWGATPVNPALVLEAESAAAYGQAFPDIFSVFNGSFVCWPYISEASMMAYSYYARPARLVFDTDIADCDPMHTELLKRAIDYQLARQIGKIVSGDANTTLSAYKEALARDSSNDKTATDVPAVGNSRNMSAGHKYDWKRL